MCEPIRRKYAAKFTLLELMIVVIIVSILVASALPLYRSAISRAYEAEIVASLGTIRTVQRIHKNIYGEYNNALWGAEDSLEGRMYIIRHDFADMRYVNWDDFGVVKTPEGFEATWTGTISGYRYSEVTMDQVGNITRGKQL